MRPRSGKIKLGCPHYEIKNTSSLFTKLLGKFPEFYLLGWIHIEEYRVSWLNKTNYFCSILILLLLRVQSTRICCYDDTQFIILMGLVLETLSTKLNIYKFLESRQFLEPYFAFDLPQKSLGKILVCPSLCLK